MQLFTAAIQVCVLLGGPVAVARAAVPWSQLGSVVEIGSKVTVTLRNGAAVDGAFLSVSETAITVNASGQPMETPRVEVHKVSRAGKRSLKKPILFGAAIGAGAGAAIGVAAGGCKPSDFICFGRAITVPVTAAAGGLCGAASGLVFGLLRPNRAILYTAPAP